MRLLLRLVDGAVFGFASWTLGYQVVLWSRLPAWFCYWAWIPVLIFFGVCLGPVMSRKLSLKQEQRSLVALGLFSLPVLWIVGTTVGYWQDNFSYVHRALWQLKHLGEPFALNDPSIAGVTVPAISPFHVATSLEPLGSMGSKAFGINTLWGSLTLLPLITVPFVLATTLLLLKFFRFSNRACVVGLCLFIVASFLDGNAVRSVGHFGPLRLSEGKCILAWWFPSIAMLYTYRFLFNPTLKRSVMILAPLACAVGWSSSGIFVGPATVGCVALALTLWRIRQPLRKTLKSAAVLLPMLYPVLVILVAILVFPWKLQDEHVWETGWPLDWIKNVSMTAVEPWGYWRNLALVALCGLLAPKQTRAYGYMTVFAVVCVLLLFNPITGPKWLQFVAPAVYWRLGYMISFPIASAILAASWASRSKEPQGWFALAPLSALALSLPFSVQGTVPISRVPFGAVRLPQDIYYQAQRLKRHIQDKTFVAPTDLSCMIMMEYPELKCLSVREVQTDHCFSNSGLLMEGNWRVNLQKITDGYNLDNWQGLGKRLPQVIIEKEFVRQNTLNIYKGHIATDIIAEGDIHVLTTK